MNLEEVRRIAIDRSDELIKVNLKLAQQAEYIKILESDNQKLKADYHAEYLKPEVMSDDIEPGHNHD